MKKRCYFCNKTIEHQIIAELKNNFVVAVCPECIEAYADEIRHVITFLDGKFVEFGDPNEKQ